MDFETLLLQPACKLLPHSTPFVFYEGGEIVGGKRIPLTTTKKEREWKIGADSQGDNNKNSAGIFPGLEGAFWKPEAKFPFVRRIDLYFRGGRRSGEKRSSG